MDSSSEKHYVEFTVDWKFKWSEYANIDGPVRKYFITSFKNFPIRWHAQLKTSRKDASKLSFYVYYDDGPMEEIDDVIFEVGVLKGTKCLEIIETMDAVVFQRGHCLGFKKFDVKDPEIVRSKYELDESDPLVYQITMKIPTDAFSFGSISDSLSPAWSTCLFELVRDPKKSADWNVKLISRDGVEFYCHKIVVAQSNPLKTMVNDPLRQDEAIEQQQPAPPGGQVVENQSSTVSKKKNEYNFPTLSPNSLQCLIEFLYTGNATTTVVDLSVTEVFEVFDAAEQYDLMSLKELCAVALWKRAAGEPRAAFEIARFADLFGMKYLKDQAMDVLVENYKSLGIKPSTLADKFGGQRQDELLDEFISYMDMRLRASVLRCFGDH